MEVHSLMMTFCPVASSSARTSNDRWSCGPRVRGTNDRVPSTTLGLDVGVVHFFAFVLGCFHEVEIVDGLAHRGRDLVK